MRFVFASVVAGRRRRGASRRVAGGDGGSERGTARRLRQAIGVATRLRPEDRTATRPDRRPAAAGTRAARALLPPGLLPPPLTKPRVLVAAVPARRDASWLRTTSCSRDSRSGPARTAAGTSTSPTLLPPCETTGTVISCSAMRLPTRLGPLANEDRPPPGAGNRPAHEKEMLLRPNRDHLEVADGDRSAPWRPAIRLPLNTRPGYERLPIDPPCRKYSWVPCEPGKTREVVSLHDARGTVALAHATHVDALAARNSSATITSLPTAAGRHWRAGTRGAPRRSRPRLPELSRHGLGRRWGLTTPNPSCAAA